MSVRMIVRVQLLKIKFSRFIREVRDGVKSIFTKKKEYSGVEDLFAPEEEEVVVPENKEITKKKLKSSIFMFLAGGAMGVVHSSSASVKYGVALSRNSLLAYGVATGLAVACIWYNFVDASRDDMSVEDIEMTMEIVSSAATGVSFNIDEDEFKMIDIAHTLVTGDKSDIEILRDRGDIFSFDDFNDYNSDRMRRRMMDDQKEDKDREDTKPRKKVTMSDIDPDKDTFDDNDVETAKSNAKYEIDEEDGLYIIPSKKKKKTRVFDDEDEDVPNMFMPRGDRPMKRTIATRKVGENKWKRVHNRPGSKLPDFDEDRGPRRGIVDTMEFEV